MNDQAYKWWGWPLAAGSPSGGLIYLLPDAPNQFWKVKVIFQTHLCPWTSTERDLGI
jgi:hypothetical protein